MVGGGWWEGVLRVYRVYWGCTGSVLECTAVVCAWYGGNTVVRTEGIGNFWNFLCGWRSNGASTRLDEVQYLCLYCAVYPLRGTGTGFL